MRRKLPRGLQQVGDRIVPKPGYEWSPETAAHNDAHGTRLSRKIKVVKASKAAEKAWREWDGYVAGDKKLRAAFIREFMARGARPRAQAPARKVASGTVYARKAISTPYGTGFANFYAP